MRHFLHLLIAFLMIVSQPAITQATDPFIPHPRESEAINAASDWLDLVESGNDKQSYERLTSIFQRNLTPEAWRDSVTERNVKAGKRLSRKLRGVVWYDNPTNAPLPGLYAAVEFDSVFENTDKHFQFVILHSQDKAPFKIMRNEFTVTLKNSNSSERNAR